MRYGQGLGQNIVTPGDIQAEVPMEGDMPYAGTLTYSLGWQNFNRDKASAFEVTFGVLGKESLAEQVQVFVHADLGAGDKPMGWDTQRESEPLFNMSYQYLRRLAHAGRYDAGWAAQLEAGPSFQLGNLVTGADLSTTLRIGWNMPEGFASYASPPGRGIFQHYHLPKPDSVSPHGFDVAVGARASRWLYSVLYDGSFITNDDREVEREDYVFAVELGLNYYFHDRFSFHLALVANTDALVKEAIPDPPDGGTKTSAKSSFGSVVFDFRY